MTELLKLAIDFHNKKISVNEFQELYLDKWNGGTKGVTQDEQNKEISIYYATECYNLTEFICIMVKLMKSS